MNHVYRDMALNERGIVNDIGSRCVINRTGYPLWSRIIRQVLRSSAVDRAMHWWQVIRVGVSLGHMRQKFQSVGRVLQICRYHRLINSHPAGLGRWLLQQRRQYPRLSINGGPWRQTLFCAGGALIVMLRRWNWERLLTRGVSGSW